MEEIKKYIIGIMMFTLGIVCGVSMLWELSKSDTTFTDDETFKQFNKSFDRLNRVTEATDNIKGDFEEDKQDFGVFGTLGALVGTAWQTIRLTFSSFGFMNSVFVQGSVLFGIPNWISGLIIAIIITIIAFTIYKAIFRVQWW